MSISCYVGPLVISLKDEFEFIKSILIPAFNPDNELETSKQRNEWMRMRAISTHWDAGIYEKLLIRYGTVTSLDEAKLKKAETERKFAEVEVERKLKVEIQWKLEMVEMQRKLEMVEMQRKLKMVEAEMQRKLEMVEAEMQRKLEMVVAEMQGKLEKAEAERKLEMVEVERKLSKKSIISFSLIVFTLILSFVCIAITC